MITDQINQNNIIIKQPIGRYTKVHLRSGT